MIDLTNDVEIAKTLASWGYDGLKTHRWLRCRVPPERWVGIIKLVTNPHMRAQAVA